MSSRRARRAAVGAALALALAVVQVAQAESPVVRYTAADQAAAKAAVLRAADLGAGWKGGYRKAAPMSAESCPGLWEPKQRDLVITGVAESAFTVPGVRLTTTAQVYRTERMAQLDWARTVVHPAATACMRRQVTAQSTPELRFASLTKTPFPRIGERAVRFRVIGVYTPAGGGTPMKMLLDAIAFGRGRTAISLNVIAPFGERASVEAMEARLARALVARFKA